MIFFGIAMKYAGLLKNDFVNGIGVCVSVWVQGCPYRCKGCHNPQTWDDNGGIEVDEDDLIAEIVSSIDTNGVVRNLSILGGEPLYDKNPNFLLKLIQIVKSSFPHIKIFLWTGAEKEEIEEMKRNEDTISKLLEMIDVIICGRFDINNRNVSLPLVGSSNQEIIFLKNKEVNNNG